MQDQDKIHFPKNLGLDDIIAEKSDLEKFECSICLGMVRDPWFCTNLNCGKPFCKEYCL